MAFFLLVLTVLAGIAVYGVLSVLGNRIARHGFLILAWRFLTGHPWHGKPVTDRGWLRPGTRALTATGHAPRFHFRRRIEQTAMRTGSVLLLVVIAWSYLVNPQVTGWTIVCLLFVSLTYIGWRARCRWAQRQHRRTWIEPLHVVCAPLAGWPVANAPGTWLAVESDRSKAVLSLPPGVDFSDPKRQEQLARAATAKLGIEAPEVSWRLGGPEPALTITRSQPPPEQVVLADIQKYFDEAGTEVLVLGLGKLRARVQIDLDGDSAHVGLTMGSGGGKSVTSRLILAQMLYKGCIGLVLDPKRISHTWARDLPNVAYARDDEELHEALLWLAAEGDRRNRVADVAADIEGRVNANVGPRIIVIAEELNTMMKRLRAHWRRVRESGDPVRSPALDALEEILCMGRQVRINVVMIGQRLSDKATGGGGDARENLAALIFARYKPSTWKMLCPDMPMPPRTTHKLRAEVVTDVVRQTQVALLTGVQARELALAGQVAVCPAGMPFAGPPLPDTVTQRELADRPDLESETVSPGHNGQPPPREIAAEPVTLSAAVALGIIPKKLHAARNDRHRDKDGYPRPVGRDGLAALYDPVELADYYAAKEAPCATSS